MEPEQTVFIVDDDQAVRDSVKRLIESVGWTAQTFASAQEFLDAYDPARAGCLVLDIRMRGMSGLDLLEELPKRQIHLPVIIVTGHGDVPAAVRAMQAGAVDFIEKPFNDQRLLDRVQRAIDDDGRARREQAARTEFKERLARLTRRERSVLDLVVAGLTNKEIAGQLGVSCRAIEAHRAKVMERMAARSVADLVRMVCLRTIVPPPAAD